MRNQMSLLTYLSVLNRRVSANCGVMTIAVCIGGMVSCGAGNEVNEKGPDKSDAGQCGQGQTDCGGHCAALQPGDCETGTTAGTGSGGVASGGAPSIGSADGGDDGVTGSAPGGGTSGEGDSPAGGSPAGGSPAGGADSGGNSGAGGSTSGGTTGNGGVNGDGGVTGDGGGVGTGGERSTITLEKFVGNITTNNSVDTGGMKFADYWDQITPENAGKWGSVQSSAGSGRNWGTLDAIYAYTEDNGIIFKEHAFVWGSQQPGGSPSASDVESWMKEFCERYPNTLLIDVVNEPPPHTEPSYAENLGGGTNGSWAWITKAFELADQHCPNAILILNDYNNIEWPDDVNHFIDIVKTIQAAGAPIDAVGAQAHDLDHSSISTSTVKSNLDKLNAETGLPVYITEYDISDSNDAGQLSKYQEQIPFFLETDYIKGVTIWGWIYGSTWSQSPNSGLVKNGSPRSAMTWLMNELGRPVP